MFKNEPKGRFIYALLLLLATLLLCFSFGFSSDNSIWIPLILVAYFFACRFDVPLRELGHVNADHIVVFPAAILLNNPLLTGIIGGIAYIFERIYREGIKNLKLGQILSFFIVIINNTLASFILLKAGAFKENVSLWKSYPLLLLALVVFASFGFLLLVLDRLFCKASFNLKSWLKHLVKYSFFLVMSSPFLALFLLAISEKHLQFIVLSFIPLISSIWFLRVNFKLAERNDELILSYRKQEFLQQLLLQETGSIDNQNFLKNLLLGLKEFVKWDRDFLYILSLEFEKEPIVYSLSEMPPDPHNVIASIENILDQDIPLKEPQFSSGKDFSPLLDTKSKARLIVPLATDEISFGVLILEKFEPPFFSDSEIKFIHLSLIQIARFIQDRILKGQLMTTNQTLLKQTHYLSEILKISNLLKIHLSSHEILEEVAKGISESLGFQRVLISLYRKEDKVFERFAQSGLEEIWSKISEVKPPENNILRHFKEEYKIGNCYFVRNVQPTAYTIVPNRKKSEGQDLWQPDDALFVPLLTSDNKLLGVISVDEPKDSKIPSLETLNALEILANQAVHALESAEIHSEVKHHAVVDGLTNLYNHRYFQESLTKLLKQSIVMNSPFSILMMDLDNFKEINDTYGHLAGDAVLKSIGQTLIEVTRKNDVAARYGGEEFAVLLSGLDKNQAGMVAERIRSLVEKRVITDESVNVPLRVTISIGVAAFPEHAKEQRELLKIADIALYRAKQAGKNRVAEGP
ncbi:MAG: sensor domain-containing diguanylate cyclase [Acidobacteriota bacterium]